jgi:hypothetical protein
MSKCSELQTSNYYSTYLSFSQHLGAFPEGHIECMGRQHRQSEGEQQDLLLPRLAVDHATAKTYLEWRSSRLQIRPQQTVPERLVSTLNILDCQAGSIEIECRRIRNYRNKHLRGEVCPGASKFLGFTWSCSYNIYEDPAMLIRDVREASILSYFQ